VRRGATYALLRSLMIIAFLVLIGRLWYMQVVEVRAYRATAVESKTETRPVYAPRGIIYDSSGRPLVRNLPEINVTVIPAQWHSDDGVAESRLLSRLLHHHPGAAHIRWLIWHTVNTSPYVNTTPVIVKREIRYRTFLLVDSHANQLPGVEAGLALDHRQYLDSAPYALSHILGYTGTGTALGDTIGKSGLEAEYERQLHGVNGIEAAQINRYGDQVTPWKMVSKPVPGDGLRLTINGTFENEVAQAIDQAMKKNDWSYGAAVVMNPSNGHILAMVSLPSYNANVYTRIPVDTRATNRLIRDPLHPFVDNSYGGEFPPGSIYKIVTATAGLATGVITPSTIVDDTGKLQRYPGALIFHGWYGPGLGPVDVVHAIAESSDIFFYQVAGGGPDIPGDGLGPYRLAHWARRYGLGQHSGIELPDATGMVPTAKLIQQTQHRPWSYGDSYNSGIGQGDDLVTPLQMARVVSVIANGGTLVRPTIVQGITGPDGHRFLRGQDFGAVPDIVRRHDVPAWIAHLIGYGMRLGVTLHGVYPAWGTSYGEIDPQADAAGKTGTAQTCMPNSPAGQCDATTDAWWVGFAPYNHPKIALAVVFPDSDSEGAFAAAPVANKIILDYEHKPAPNWLNNVVTKLDFDN